MTAIEAKTALTPPHVSLNTTCMYYVLQAFGETHSSVCEWAQQAV